MADLLLATVGAKRSPTDSPAQKLVAEFLGRTGKPMQASLKAFPTEPKLLEFLAEQARRTRPLLILADSRGKQLNSEEFAGEFRRALDGGVQQIVCAIGPPDGWSAGARERAGLTISFGRITMPHELATIVLAEQIYRVTTILSGHPYHSGH